jgi:PPOX class probable F420-dependent enzyme
VRKALLDDPPGSVRLPAGRPVGVLALAADYHRLLILAAKLPLTGLIGVGRRKRTRVTAVGILPGRWLAGAIRLEGVLIALGSQFTIALIERVTDRTAREATEQNARSDALGTATRRGPDQATRSRARRSAYDGLGPTFVQEIARIAQQGSKAIRRSSDSARHFIFIVSLPWVCPFTIVRQATGLDAIRGPGSAISSPPRTPVKLDTAALETLDRRRYISLATFRRSGDTVKTPVWFARCEGKFYVFTAAGSGKVKRLKNDQRVRAAPCGPRGRLRGKWIEGQARRIEDPAIERTAYAALLAKYGWQMRVLNFFSKLSGRIEERAILELDL